MHSDLADLNQWMVLIPRSRMVFPKSFKDRLKYCLWRIYAPFHPLVRDLLTFFHILTHEGRQPYLLGKITPDKARELTAHLVANGYGNHFVAWNDNDELVSLRRVNDFKFQYHIRIFKDGEVRGHYEFTPECHPLLHIKAIHQEDRRKEFMTLLGKFLQ